MTASATMRECRLAALAVAGLLALSPVSAGVAATLDVTPGTAGDGLRAALAAAAPGDVLQLAPGVYRGSVRIDRPVTVEGGPEAIIDGGGKGSVVVIAAPDVTLRDLTIRNSGASLEKQNAGVFVGKAGDRALVESNRIVDNLIGVYLWGPDDAVVRGNTIHGRRYAHVNQRGDDIQLWNTPGSVIENNDVRFGRDGIYVTTSKRNLFRGNRFRDLRYAIHYMYTNTSEISGNVSIGNRIGFALMFSHNLKVRGNLSQGDGERGILLNYVNNSSIEDNVVRGKSKKCVFIYNANKNRFVGNRFEGCEIGIHFTAGSERNEIYDNAFINNRTQVKYVGTRVLEWSYKGRGNYWSDDLAFDLNGDGIADRPYKPNDMVDRIVWRHPLAKLLLTSPAVQILRWAQKEFPTLHPGGVIDSAPLMRPPPTAVTWGGA